MKITVNTANKYDVLIKKGAIKTCGVYIREVFSACKIALITDSNVDGLYAETVVKSLIDSGFSVCKYVLPAGEKSKNLASYGKIIDFLAKNKITRTDKIVALGGGVTGDVAGFSAATYLRGIEYIQIPTTLLAATDSSVGGKTALDTRRGKNLIGAFYSPSLVVFDPETLVTLPTNELNGGAGEVVKYALIAGGELFDLVSQGKITDERCVALCVEYKKAKVEADEFDNGERKLLNFGHTAAHAIEKLSGYTVSHGKAVAMGIKIIVSSCYKAGVCDKKTLDEVLGLLDSNGINYEIPFPLSKIAKAITVDKKAEGADISLILLKSVGAPFVKKTTIKEAEAFLCK